MSANDYYSSAGSGSGHPPQQQYGQQQHGQQQQYGGYPQQQGYAQQVN